MDYILKSKKILRKIIRMQQNVISYYPTYALLDSIMSYSKYDTLNLYIDLKGIARPLYMEHTRINIVESTKMARKTDSSFFTSLLEFFIFHKNYALKRGIKINFYVFYELGESFYHLNIDKKYKANRRIDNMPGLDKVGKEIFNDVIQKNLILIEKVFNKVPNIKIILSNHLEADFIPYYLIRNSLVPVTDNVCQLVYSNDHDLFQNIILGNNVYQFLKTKTKRVLKSGGEISSKYLKHECSIPDEYFPLIMAIMGDKGDGIIDKVKGAGEKTVPIIIDELVHLVGGMDNLYDNVFNGKPIFQPDAENETNDKVVYSAIEAERKRSTISKNLKLMSFELLSRYLDNPPTTEVTQRRKHIYNVMNDSTIARSEDIYSALNKISILVESENPLDILYLNKNINDYKF